MIPLLSRILEWTPADDIEVTSSEIPRLQQERGSLSRQLSVLSERIAAAEAFAESSGGYSTEAVAQVRRLESVQLFSQGESGETECPVCQSVVTQHLPALSAVRESLRGLAGELDRVERERPQIRSHIADLRTEQEKIKGRIQELDLQLRSLVAEVSRAQGLQDQNSRAARVVGRVSLYLDTVSVSPASADPREEFEVAERRVEALTEELESWDVEEIQESYLNRVGARMTDLASNLPFEHKEWPLRLDPRKVTVVADRPGRPFPMSRMGSGQNFLICHITCLLALHMHFRTEARPVPAFLMLDQPTQVYFPSEEEYRSLSGSIADTEQSPIDLVAARALFQSLFAATKDLTPGFQLIVLEHANLDMEEFQKALVEAPWQEDRALVPIDWIDS